MAQDEDSKLEGEIESHAGEKNSDNNRGLGGVFGLMLPADQLVLRESRRLAADKNTRVEDVATIACQDPVHVIELIKVANALFFSGGKSPITSTKTAIVRLGYDVVLETLDKLKERVPSEKGDVNHWLEIHRSRCKRASILARMLAEATARTLADDCQVAGLLMFVGDMLAVSHFQEKYVELAEELTRSSITYRLAQDYKFDIEYMCVNYLRRQGIPEAILFAIDRESRSRTQDRAIMKPLCAAAGEMVDAFDSNRWDKLAPGRNLPPKSPLRMLQLSENQYLKIYERASEYLFAIKALEVKQKQDALSAELNTASANTPAEGDNQAALQDEIQNLLATPATEKYDATPAPASSPAPEAPQAKTKAVTKISSIEESLASEFSLTQAPAGGRKVPRVQTTEPLVAPPPLQINRGAQIVANITEAFDQAKTSEELLSKLLEQLVDKGPFEKSALIVVSKDRKKAIVVAARGPNIGNGQQLEILDPLSPLAQCFSKVQSFGNRSNKASPWGSKAFALAPIDADHDTPVALYADCGTDGSITFEARRVFRNVVELLNQKLPHIPGGIPVELS